MVEKDNVGKMKNWKLNCPSEQFLCILTLFFPLPELEVPGPCGKVLHPIMEQSQEGGEN